MGFFNDFIRDAIDIFRPDPPKPPPPPPPAPSEAEITVKLPIFGTNSTVAQHVKGGMTFKIPASTLNGAFVQDAEGKMVLQIPLEAEVEAAAALDELVIIDRPSPNRNPRPDDAEISLIVLHGTAGSYPSDLEWLTSRESRVSAHYLIAPGGTIYRLVPEHQRAWHAGESSWLGVPDCNDYSIGIELSNDGKQPYTDQQYLALADLCADIMNRHGLYSEDVVGHSDVSPGRKTDPWPHFDWRRFWNETASAIDSLG